MTAATKLDPLEVHLGGRLRKLRSVYGMSQDQLGKALGLTFQQIQKYESGANRIAASRLFEIAKILNVPVSHFYEDMPEDIFNGKPTEQKEDGQDVLEKTLENDVQHREVLEFGRVYKTIKNPKLRRSILDIMRTMGSDTTKDN